MPSSSRTRRAGRWRLAAVLLLLLLAWLTFAILLAATCRPASYRPMSINQARLAHDKRNLVNLVDEIGVALNAGQTALITLDEAQINRWLAGRAHFWPDANLDLTPFDHPQIALEPDAVAVAAQVADGNWRIVLSIACKIQICAETIQIDCARARVGRLPLPVAWGLRQSAAAVAEGLPRDWRLADGQLVLPNRFTWPNGERAYKVQRLTIRDKTVQIELAPLHSERRGRP